jgi:hypothetical protein
VSGVRCLMLRLRRSGLWMMRLQSLFDVGNRRSGFVGGEGRSLVDLREKAIGL